MNEDKNMNKRIRIEGSFIYRCIAGIAKYMDKYFLDPIVGFFLPGFGDILTSTLAIPFIYISLFVVRSVPLTLAVIFNTLVDILLGMIPPWIGDIFDIFHRSYKKNLRLINGFVNDDQTIINEVNRKAIWMAILIVVCCVLIYLLYQLVEKFILWISGLF